MTLNYRQSDNNFYQLLSLYQVQRSVLDIVIGFSSSFCCVHPSRLSSRLNVHVLTYCPALTSLHLGDATASPSTTGGGAPERPSDIQQEHCFGIQSNAKRDFIAVLTTSAPTSTQRNSTMSNPIFKITCSLLWLSSTSKRVSVHDLLSSNGACFPFAWSCPSRSLSPAQISQLDLLILFEYWECPASRLAILTPMPTLRVSQLPGVQKSIDRIASFCHVEPTLAVWQTNTCSHLSLLGSVLSATSTGEALVWCRALSCGAPSSAAQIHPHLDV